MKRCLMFFLLLSLLCQALSVYSLEISAQCACVIEAQTGQILYDKNANSRHSMASTTKIMTALVALENTQPSDMVTVSANAATTEGSSIYLKQGETLSMETLLYGLLLESGNDAAVAIAEHIGGSVGAFADMMTKRAQALGAKATQFQNPNGLDADGHFTTAYDLALITKTALENRDFSTIVSTKRKSYPADDDSPARTFVNHNKLLSLYNGCVGVKTGFTKKTGRCLVSAATRDHITLICVTLNAPNDWNDHTKLLNKGFETMNAKPLIMKGMVLKNLRVADGSSQTVELMASEDFFIALKEGEGLSKVKLEYQLPAFVPAPISAGSHVGRLLIRYNGSLMREIDLCAATDIAYVEPPKANLWQKIKDFFKNLLQFS